MPVSSRRQQKERARQERLAREAKLAAAARRRQLLGLAGAGVVAVAAVAAAVVIALTSGGGPTASQPPPGGGTTPKLALGSLAALGELKPPPPPGPLGPEQVPIPAGPQLAGRASMASGNTVDGIGCLGQEQTLFHIHAHLAVFVDGAPRRIPYGIGIVSPQVQNTPQGPFVAGGSCFYYLHTHAADGIIHIESPIRRTYTLGEFFDIWGQPLSPHRVGPAIGPVRAIYDRKLYEGSPRDIPLQAHAQIQLDVGKPLIAPVSITFPGGL
jgi:hypothetical protein